MYGVEVWKGSWMMVAERECCRAQLFKGIAVDRQIITDGASEL
jgi:hypothetical protein